MSLRKALASVFLLVSSLSFCEAGKEFSVPFTVTSGEDQVVGLPDIQGKFVICFYETKETKNKNKILKDRLETLKGTLSADSQKNLFILPVADCSTASWPFVGFWKSALVEQSKKIGHTLYGDWDGKMRDSFHFVKDESNLIVINTNGEIVYRNHGLIS